HALVLNAPEIRVVLVTVPACTDLMDRGLRERPWITPVVMAQPGELTHAFEELRRMGIERISCVGGRTIATHLLDRSLVEDVYLTTSPHRGGEPNSPMYPKPLVGRTIVRKRGTGADQGVVFEHFRL